MFEIRPLFGPLPASPTSKLPFGLTIIFVGALSPLANTDVVADWAVTLMSANDSSAAAASARVVNFVVVIMFSFSSIHFKD
jgi:hypothetical protein